MQAERAEGGQRLDERVGVAISSVSVTSRITEPASTPERSRTAATTPAKSGRRSCRADTLIAIVSEGSTEWRATRARHASSSTHAPSGTMSPSSSARGMNSFGLTSPRVG